MVNRQSATIELTTVYRLSHDMRRDYRLKA
jgi:hypothetical protein